VAWTHTDTKYDRSLVLSADLTRVELAEALEALHFQNADHKQAVKVDRDVAALLARLLRECKVR
jgi:hypothetical protein